MSDVASEDRARLLEAISLLKAMLSNAARLGNKWLVANRRDAVDLRRKIATQNVEISKLGERSFRDSRHTTDFIHQHSKLRSASALHQASWPIVAIEPDNSDYLRSVKATPEANEVFIA